MGRVSFFFERERDNFCRKKKMNTTSPVDTGLILYVINLFDMTLGLVVIIIIVAFTSMITYLLAYVLRKTGVPNSKLYRNFDIYHVITIVINGYIAIVLLFIYIKHYEINVILTFEMMAIIISSTIAFSYIIKPFLTWFRDRNTFKVWGCYRLIKKGEWGDKAVARVILPSMKSGYLSLKIKNHSNPIHVRWEHIRDYNHMMVDSSEIGYFKVSEEEKYIILDKINKKVY